MIKKFLEQSWLVMVSALIFGLMVAGVNGVLKERIDANAIAKLQKEMTGILSEAQSFEDVTDDTGAVLYTVGKDAGGAAVGYALQAEGGGFADKIGMLIAVDAHAQTLLGIAVLKSNETPGFGDKIKNPPFKDQFKQAPAKNLIVIKTGDPSLKDREIVSITGATISSESVTEIVNKAMLTLRRRLGL